MPAPAMYRDLTARTAPRHRRHGACGMLRTEHTR